MRRLRTTAVPPAPDSSRPALAPRRLWPSLTVESQEQILVTLSRIVAQQLATILAVQEATDERS